VQVYFDTDAFRHIGTAFATTPLEPELRKGIIVSPISALEVLSQLTIAKADVVLAQIHAMHNWLPDPPLILPMGGYAIAEVGFGLVVRDDNLDSIVHALDVCLTTGENDVDTLRTHAGELKDYLDGFKQREADKLAAIKAIGGQWNESKLNKAIAEGLAARARIDSKNALATGLAISSMPSSNMSGRGFVSYCSTATITRTNQKISTTRSILTNFCTSHIPT
jgi:hypothetical protein